MNNVPVRNMAPFNFPPGQEMWFVYAVVGDFNVINTQEKNALTPDILLSLISGAWLYVPLLFGVFFAFDEKEGVYLWRGVKGILRGAKDVAVSGTPPPAVSMS